MGLFKMIFKPHDGTRQRVKTDVEISRRDVEYAVNRFEETIRNLLDRNDQLTGRKNDKSATYPSSGE